MGMGMGTKIVVMGTHSVGMGTQPVGTGQDGANPVGKGWGWG